MPAIPPFNLRRWIEQNRDLLKPPVGNKLLFEDSAFIIMAVGGPNSRKDFHHDPSEEFFFQIEGDMVLKTVQDGRVADVPIREGEMYLLARASAALAAASRRQRRASWSNGAAVLTNWMASRGTAKTAGISLYLERVAVRQYRNSAAGDLFALLFQPASIAPAACAAPSCRLPA